MNLPKLILYKIYIFVDLDSLKNLSLINKYSAQILNDNYYWKLRTLKDYGEQSKVRQYKEYYKLRSKFNIKSIDDNLCVLWIHSDDFYTESSLEQFCSDLSIGMYKNYFSYEILAKKDRIIVSTWGKNEVFSNFEKDFLMWLNYKEGKHKFKFKDISKYTISKPHVINYYFDNLFDINKFTEKHNDTYYSGMYLNSYVFEILIIVQEEFMYPQKKYVIRLIIYEEAVYASFWFPQYNRIKEGIYEKFVTDLNKLSIITCGISIKMPIEI